jgi:hypothetical protein
MSGSNQTGGNAASPGAKQVSPKGFKMELTLYLKGLASAIPDGSSLLVAGQSWTKDALTTRLQAGLGLYDGVEIKKRDLKAARQTLAQGLPPERKLLKDVRDALVAFLGRGNPMLEQFGIRFHGGSRALTAQQLAMRAAKAKLTRAVRHTLGPKQRLALHVEGTPTLTLGPKGATVTPAGAPAPSSSTDGASGSKGAA